MYEQQIIDQGSRDTEEHSFSCSVCAPELCEMRGPQEPPTESSSLRQDFVSEGLSCLAGYWLTKQCHHFPKTYF